MSPAGPAGEAAPGSEAQACERIRTAETLRILGLLPRASNATFLATLEPSGERVVYKPRDGETPLWDFPDGTLCAREVAAFEVSEALGWHLVPATVLRAGPVGPGAVQRFVAFDPAEHALTLAPRHRGIFQRIVAFDWVVNNADRKAGHCVLEGATRRIWALDHGVSFHTDPKLRTVLWEWAGGPLPADVAAGLERLLKALDGPLAARLERLLSPGEVAALGDRSRAILEAGVFPEPGPGRPVPWPPL